MKSYSPVSGRIILMIYLLALGFPLMAAQVSTNHLDYVEGNVLVRFRPTETVESARQIAAGHGCELKRHFDRLSQFEGHVTGLLHSSKSTQALLAELRADPAVIYAEPDYLRYVTDMRVPNDPKFSQMWGLQNTGQTINGLTGTSNTDISFLKAWGLARPSTNEVVVGVIDTGLDITHPDIVSNLWVNHGEIAGNHIDDDTNGYVDDVNGYDFALNTGTITDAGFHGTHVSGTIAASGNNGIGVIGVDYQAHIMVLKASSDGETISSSAAISAIDYATMMKGRGVNVVALNASYGGGSASSTESSAIQAAGTAGIIFCAAAGNNTNNNDTSPTYPANYRSSNMIVVAATDQNDQLATFSNYGAKTVDIAAPGVNVISLAPVDQPSFDTDVQQSTNIYQAEAFPYSGATTSNGITATIYYCGVGNPSDFPAAVKHNIALIQRGTLNFSVKVTNAMAAGAVAAIIFNNAAGQVDGTLVYSNVNWIPTVALVQTDGQTLEAAAPVTGTVLNYLDPANIYQFLDGTSMATPHISGAVAFAAMNFPSETVTQRIQRILTNSTPVSGLSGKVVSGGRLNLARIVDTDTNGLPDWWEQQYFGHLTGTIATADPDHDGANNLAEFLAGTNPTNALSVLAFNQASRGSNGFAMQWPSVSGRYYRVLSTTNLASGFNTLIQTNISATPPFNTYTNSISGNSKNAYYRLQLEQ